MYKSRLQELCQKRSWSLPIYSTRREGEDHAPRFQTSVVVNELSFESSDLCRSSKDSQNEAARIAFEHLVHPERLVRSPSPVAAAASPSSSCSSQGSSSPNTVLNNDPSEKGATLQKNPEISKSSMMHVDGSAVKGQKEQGELQHIYKNKLQNYAMKRNLNLPIYSCKREGPPHAIRFKASVTIDGKTFESPELFRTLKEAEHAAAKAALSSLSEDGIQEEDSSFYKNLLQDLARKEGFPLPNYVTVRTGPSHIPTFACTVEIEGYTFQGTAAKTKKQAETNAAKVAYYSLEQCRLSRKSALLYQGSHAKEAHERVSSSSIPIVTVDSEKDLDPRDTMNSTPSLGSLKLSEVNKVMDQELHSAVMITASASSSSQSHLKPGTNSTYRNGGSSDEIYAKLRDPFPSIPISPEDGKSSPSTDSECSDDAVTILNNDLSSKTRSSLLCNKVQVFPRVPGMKLPKDTTVLPISDDKWVAVSSNFTNQQGKTKDKGKQIAE